MKLGDLARNKTLVTYEESDRWRLPKQLVGIEVEVENFSFRNEDRIVAAQKKQMLEQFWTIDSDGSLRNNGAELITKPIYGKDLENSLLVLEKYMPVGITWSIRTSVHVHMDVRTLSSKELLSIVLAYALFERPLFEFCADRRDSQFCIPWYCGGGEVAVGLIATLQDKTSTMANIHVRINSINGRYSACNLRSISKYGTLEFRHMHGTNDAHELGTWVNLLMGIISAKSLDSDYIIDKAMTHEGRLTLIEEIFKDDASVILGTPDLEYNLHQGALSVQELLTRASQYVKPFIAKEKPMEEGSSYKKLRAKEKQFKQKKSIRTGIGESSLADAAARVINGDIGRNNPDMIMGIEPALAPARLRRRRNNR